MGSGGKGIGEGGKRKGEVKGQGKRSKIKIDNYTSAEVCSHTLLDAISQSVHVTIVPSRQSS